ncbi:MAG: hypothetical protein CVU39_22955 [Chloroflexi bacterium HGW-Chloroflexi-10]|nr:MAG: hypothetical protein CVU39_22955 [Chloroflexi bacterium HGW-Chloroflexi-10]
MLGAGCLFVKKIPIGTNVFFKMTGMGGGGENFPGSSGVFLIFNVLYSFWNEWGGSWLIGPPGPTLVLCTRDFA